MPGKKSSKNYPRVPAGNTRTRPYPLPDFLGRVPENFRVRVKSGNTRTRTREFPKFLNFSKSRYKSSNKTLLLRILIITSRPAFISMFIYAEAVLRGKLDLCVLDSIY